MSLQIRRQEFVAIVGPNGAGKSTLVKMLNGLLRPSQGTVRIDGNLDGEIHTEGVLLVGEDAVLTAKITAGTVVCKGKITGDISAREKVKLRAPAVVNAGVKAPLLAMEEGVVFNGTLEMSQTGTREPQGTTRGQGVKLVNG